jgi:hypothetical protein
MIAPNQTLLFVAAATTVEGEAGLVKAMAEATSSALTVRKRITP